MGSRGESGVFKVREFKLPAFSSPRHFQPESGQTFVVTRAGIRR
jgi:hypothetical protein